MLKINRVLGSALVLLVSVISTAAQAQTADTPRETRRETRQEKRIEQGAASGSLNPQEQAKLQANQAKIDSVEAKAEADGTVTPKEKARIEKAQDRQSRAIARKKHNKR